MRPAILALVVPAAMLVTACSSTTPAAPGMPAPSTTISSPTPADSVPAASALPPPSVAPSEVALTEVEVTMTDAMRFAPDPITVKAGEPITFNVRNAGLIVHEFVVGTEAEQADHAAAMANGEMTHRHDNAISVEPGKVSSLTMTFAEAGSLLVGCHEPGHYDAGMKTSLEIVG